MSRSQEKIGEKWGGKAFFEPTLVTVKCEITFFPPDLIYSTRQNEDGKKNMNAMRNEAELGDVFISLTLFLLFPQDKV